MNNLIWVAVAAVLSALGSPHGHTQGHVRATAASTNPPAALSSPRPVGPTGIVLPAADPMATELQRELERGQREYAGLFQRLAQAGSEREAMEVEEDMRQQRVELQVGLLRIQSAYARRAGRSAFADQLDRAIAALIAAEPAPPATPDSQHRL